MPLWDFRKAVHAGCQLQKLAKGTGTGPSLSPPCPDPAITTNTCRPTRKVSLSSVFYRCNHKAQSLKKKVNDASILLLNRKPTNDHVN